jgi:hypothetical protein
MRPTATVTTPGSTPQPMPGSCSRSCRSSSPRRMSGSCRTPRPSSCTPGWTFTRTGTCAASTRVPGSTRRRRSATTRGSHAPGPTDSPPPSGRTPRWELARCMRQSGASSRSSTSTVSMWFPSPGLSIVSRCAATCTTCSRASRRATPSAGTSPTSSSQTAGRGCPGADGCGETRGLSRSPARDPWPGPRCTSCCATPHRRRPAGGAATGCTGHAGHLAWPGSGHGVRAASQRGDLGGTGQPESLHRPPRPGGAARPVTGVHGTAAPVPGHRRIGGARIRGARSSWTGLISLTTAGTAPRGTPTPSQAGQVDQVHEHCPVGDLPGSIDASVRRPRASPRRLARPAAWDLRRPAEPATAAVG